MMIRVYVFLVLAMSLMSCSYSGEVTIVVDRSEVGDLPISIFNSKEHYELEFDEEGICELNIDVEHPNYYKVKVPPFTREIYVEAGSVLNLKPQIKDELKLEINFSGDLSSENKYLNERSNVYLSYLEDNQEVYLNLVDSGVKSYWEEMEAYDLGFLFSKIEKKRIYYRLMCYSKVQKIRQVRNRPNQPFEEAFIERLIEDLEGGERVGFLEEYQFFATQAIYMVAVNGKTTDHHECINLISNWISTGISSQRVKEGMLNYFAVNYINAYGTSKADELLKLYDATVQNVDMKSNFNALIKEKKETLN